MKTFEKHAMQQSNEALFANEAVNVHQMSSAAGLYRYASPTVYSEPALPLQLAGVPTASLAGSS